MLLEGSLFLQLQFCIYGSDSVEAYVQCLTMAREGSVALHG
jgi:hypothetical protein